MTTPFDYANNICQSEESMWMEGVSESEYNSFLVNKALSYHYDTIMHAAEMDRRFNMHPKMQYDYLRLAIKTKKKRFSSWQKPEQDEIAVKIGQHYQMNTQQIQSYLSLLNKDEIQSVMEKIDKGGRSGK